MRNIKSLKKIIDSPKISIQDKMEALEAAFQRDLSDYIGDRKKKAIAQVNNCHDFDKSNARIIIQGI